MQTITITLDVTDAEHALLVAARSDKPSPDRVRAMLLSEARSQLRRLADMAADSRAQLTARTKLRFVSKDQS